MFEPARVGGSWNNAVGIHTYKIASMVQIKQTIIIYLIMETVLENLFANPYDRCANKKPIQANATNGNG